MSDKKKVFMSDKKKALESKKFEKEFPNSAKHGLKPMTEKQKKNYLKILRNRHYSSSYSSKLLSNK